MDDRIGIPPFEFLSLTGNLEVKRLFIRDEHRAWYHRGIPGYGDNFTDLAKSLKPEVAQADRVVTIGNSAGGYAALAMGTLLGADMVIAFSPQTTLDLETLESMDDHRWDDQIGALSNAIDRRWADLASAITASQQAATNYRIYFDETHSADRLHAERLAPLDNLRFYRFGRGGHWLVKRLRDCGALEKIIIGAIDGVK